MPFIRLTKIFSFEMAHFLWKHDGKCENIHGHSYQLQVTIKGKVFSGKEHPKDGMLLDFTDFKKIVGETIIQDFDHALVVNKNIDAAFLRQLKNFNKKNIVVEYQPTCENLLLDFATRLKKKLPAGIQLFSLKLIETPQSFAEWHYSDNSREKV